MIDIADLPDGLARNENLPEDAMAVDRNRTFPDHRNWLVLIGVCTHLGCVPKGHKTGDVRGKYGGWKCPCHFSLYDTSGRVRWGAAVENLRVPPYKFLTDTMIKIG